jgi:hypothetical protein
VHFYVRSFANFAERIVEISCIPRRQCDVIRFGNHMGNRMSFKFRTSGSGYTSQRFAAVAFLSLVGIGQALGAPLIVPNGDFSDPANDGSIGGGLLGAAGSGPLGAGPWNGSYSGVAALLAPPQLTIGNGQAQLSGLALDALQMGNSGAFGQSLASGYVGGKHYVLTADAEVGTSVLAADVLSSGNIGLAMTSGATTLASTQSSPAVALGLVGNDKFHLALAYDSQAADSGNIGVSLFANPQGLAAVDLLSTIAFSNVHLTQAPIPALPPAHIDPAGGTPQAATVNTAYAGPLVVAVVDAEGDPLADVAVTFSVPTAGASAALSATTVMTDIGGRASVTATANGSAGAYVITASVGGVPQAAAFALANTAVGQLPVIAQTGGAGGQAAATGAPFECELAVKVFVNNVPAPGATVVFSAPAAGASATLSDGTFSGPLLIEVTDNNGVAAVAASANAVPGSYTVTAALTALSSGALATPVVLATYPLTNLDSNNRIFADGFEPVPTMCGFR